MSNVLDTSTESRQCWDSKWLYNASGLASVGCEIPIRRYIAITSKCSVFKWCMTSACVCSMKVEIVLVNSAKVVGTRGTTGRL